MKILGSVSLLAVFLVGAAPANAFDCAKSTTKIEKAICSERDLGAADADMANAYAAVRDASNPSEKKMLALSQRRWIEQRENYCGFEEGVALAACITKETMARRLLLQGAPESGPGASSLLVPVFLQQRGDAKHYDLDYALVRFANPQSAGEKLFNLQSEKSWPRHRVGPMTRNSWKGRCCPAKKALPFPLPRRTFSPSPTASQPMRAPPTAMAA